MEYFLSAYIVDYPYDEYGYPVSNELDALPRYRVSVGELTKEHKDQFVRMSYIYSGGDFDSCNKGDWIYSIDGLSELPLDIAGIRNEHEDALVRFKHENRGKVINKEIGRLREWSNLIDTIKTSGNGGYTPIDRVSETRTEPIGETSANVDVVNKIDLSDETTKQSQITPQPVYLVDPPRPLVPSDFDESKGFWEKQDKYAERTGKSIKSLRKYRETRSGAVWIQEDNIGRDKAGNIFKKEGKARNAPYSYFVPYPPDTSDRK